MIITHPSPKEQSSVNQKKIKEGFNFFFLKKGFSYSYSNYNDSILIFILTGKVKVLFERYKEYLFAEREMIFIKQTDFQFDALQNTKILILNMDDHWFSFYENLNKDSCIKGDRYSFSLSSLIIQPKLEIFIDFVYKNFINKSSLYPNYYYSKQRELESLLKECYGKKVLINFFLRLNRDVQDFYHFILNNYKKYRGAEELIYISKLPQSTFNRKFRQLFDESPYKWIMEKRAEEIMEKLTKSDCSITKIMREYSFTDASHFNRFCKSMYGLPPSEIRKKNN
jgi:AraC-like DNA-binding protein